jgi:hypothetical protein
VTQFTPHAEIKSKSIKELNVRHEENISTKLHDVDLDNNMDMNSKSQAIQAKIEYIENYSN